jgi:hypothetical protein
MAKIGQTNLDNSQRVFVADKLMDSANVVLAVLVIGQLVTDRIQLLLLMLGLVLYIGAWLISIRYKKGGDKE